MITRIRLLLFIYLFCTNSINGILSPSRVENTIQMQQWINIRWHLPEGFTLSPNTELSDSLEQFYCNIGINRYDFLLHVPETVKGKEELILSVSSQGHPSRGLMPIILFVNK